MNHIPWSLGLEACIFKNVSVLGHLWQSVVKTLCLHCRDTGSILVKKVGHCHMHQVKKKKGCICTDSYWYIGELKKDWKTEPNYIMVRRNKRWHILHHLEYNLVTEKNYRRFLYTLYQSYVVKENQHRDLLQEVVHMIMEAEVPKINSQPSRGPGKLMV